MTKQQFTQSLILCGEACKTYSIDDLRIFLNRAKQANKAISFVPSAAVYNIKQTDTLERLKRNAMALAYLIDQAIDVADAMRSEINTIMEAQKKADEKENQKRQDAIRREERKIQNEKAKSKHQNK